MDGAQLRNQGMCGSAQQTSAMAIDQGGLRAKNSPRQTAEVVRANNQAVGHARVEEKTHRKTGRTRSCKNARGQSDSLSFLSSTPPPSIRCVVEDDGILDIEY